ncbi:MAG: PadR family transcriptional regulator [Chloroflexi bacterium]|nr:PadR family transcriptional regulator [Chloroflexota bacterium]
MTDAELAVLSIVAEGPVYGQDLQTIITQRGLREWTQIGVSSLYYVLEKLERQGLIEGRGNPATRETPRRQFQLTPAGFGVLQTAVADLLSTPREYGNGFELGLANLHVLRPAQIRTAFFAYRQELLSRLTQTRERWQQLQDSKAPFQIDAIFGHHAAMLEAELEWITEFIDAWEAQAPPDPPPHYTDPITIPRMKQVVLPHHPDSPHRVPTRPLGPRPGMETGQSEGATDLGEAPTIKETTLSARTPPHLPTESEKLAEDDVSTAGELDLDGVHDSDPSSDPSINGDGGDEEWSERETLAADDILNEEKMDTDEDER